MNEIIPAVPFYIHKKNWGNNDLFPDVMFIDTNAIRDIFEKREHGKVTQDYLVELNKRNGMIVWTPNIINELIDFLYHDEYNKLGIRKGYEKNAVKTAEYNATTQERKIIGESIYSRLDSIKLFLDNYGMQVENESEDVANLGRYLLMNYGGNRKDAYHAADTLLLGVNSVLTQDRGFLDYPNFNVYGASKRIARNYKPNQKQLDYIDIFELTGLPEFKSNSNSNISINEIVDEDKDENAS